MPVLALDTALDACSAAVLADGEVLAGAYETRPRGHGERIAAMCAEVLEEAGLVPGDLRRICVTVGPGSFTGVRIGLATARGFGVALGLPVVGLSTLTAVAVPSGGGRPLLAAHDARRGQVYVQAFGADGAPLAPPVAAAPEAAARIRRPDMALVVGSGAALLAAHLDGGVEAVEARPDARLFASLADALPVTAGAPEPLYLRAPDAVPRATG